MKPKKLRLVSALLTWSLYRSLHAPQLTNLVLFFVCLFGAECKINAMPTFHFYKGGKKIDELMGADQNKLEALIAQHS